MREGSTLARDFRGVPGTEYGFCSVECRDRFLAFPHRYAGLRGQRPPRQRGLQVLRHRRLSLAASLSPEQGARVTEALEALPGIRAVKVSGSWIEFVCDLLQVEARQIEVRLAAVGAQLGEGWEERLRQGLETCEAPNRDLHPSIQHRCQ